MNTITTKVLPWTITPDALSWCPCMDLIVFAPQSGGISLYRLSGQKVWNIAGKRKVKVIKAIWRDDGKVLAVIYDDFSYQLLKSSNGKVIFNSEEGCDVKVLRWIESGEEVDDTDFNFNSKSNSNLNTTFGSSSISKVFNIDVTDYLPKLSVLSTKPTLTIDTKSSDSISTPNKSLSFIITGSDSLNISLFGIFTIDKISIDGEKNSENQNGNNNQILFVNSNPIDISKGIIITSNTSSISYKTFNFDFINKFGASYLAEVSIIPAQASSLIEYLKESINLLKTEADLIVETNDKFMSTIPAETIKAELFDFLITGSMSESISQWIESSHEMGYKRWNKATMTNYENCRKIIFENLITGVERLIVLLSRLRGLSKWKERGIPLGLSSDDLDQALKYCERFFESLNKCLWEATEEFDKFKSFALWLELGFESVLDRVVGFSRQDEPAIVKTIDIMKYITDTLPGSILVKYLEGNDGGKVTDNASNGNLSLTIHLNKLERIFSKSTLNIKNSMKKLIYFSDESIELAPNTSKIVQRYVGDINYMLIYNTDLHTNSDVSSLLVVKIYNGIHVSKLTCETIIQADFIDDENIIYLSTNLTTELTTRSLHICDYKNLNYTKVNIESKKNMIDISKEVPSTSIEPTTTRTFDNDFIPDSFSINGREGRRIGCVLNSDHQRYIFFDLDDDSAA